MKSWMEKFFLRFFVVVLFCLFMKYRNKSSYPHLQFTIYESETQFTFYMMLCVLANIVYNFSVLASLRLKHKKGDPYEWWKLHRWISQFELIFELNCISLKFITAILEALFEAQFVVYIDNQVYSIIKTNKTVFQDGFWWPFC